MTARGVSSDVLAEINSAQSKPCYLIEARFDTADGGTVYFTDAHKSVVWGGHTYVALGHALAFDQLEESADLRVTRARMQLSAVDQTWAAYFLTVQYIGRLLIVYKAFFNTSDAVIVDPFSVITGPMDSPVWDDDPSAGSSVITVEVTSLGADIERPAGRHTNVAEQQIWFPTDTGFKNAAQIAGQTIGRQLQWGRAG